MLGVEVNGDAPLEARAGDAEILQARVNEVVDHLVDAGARQQEVRVDEQVTHPVRVLGQAEEIGLLLSVHNGAAAVRAAAVTSWLSVQKLSQGVQYLPTYLPL